MNWLKVAAVVVGGIIVFFVVDSVIHLFLGLLTALVFVAIVAGGAYAAVKINGARKRRQVKRAERHEDHQVRQERAPRSTTIEPVTPRPAPAPTSTPRHDVEDDLARLKREMGH
ncbi:MAG TPA: DUF3824 domain-containing protein [Trebonia sp.]|jgi:hypothetical protein|nr:DUF3824 domain-containing protein [Trebonia sp.]